MKRLPFNVCDYRCERCLETADCAVFRKLQERSLRDWIAGSDGSLSKRTPPNAPTASTTMTAGQRSTGWDDPRIEPLAHEASPQAIPQVTLLNAR